MGSWITPEERAEVQRLPIPQYHRPGRDQSYIDELKAMPWKALVAHCDRILRSHGTVIDITGSDPVIDLTGEDAA